jgi:hypothetical protein
MSTRPDEFDAEEMEVLKTALSESRVRSGPSAEYAADLRSRLLSVAVAVQPLRMRSKHRIMLASVFAVGLSAVVLGTVWFFNSEPAWASAIRRARAQACIHARIVRDNVEKGELWVSPGLDVIGGRLSTTALLFDYTNNVFLRYDEKRKILYRAVRPGNARLTQELSSVSNLAEVFRRSPSAPSLLPDERIERWSLKSQMIDGKPCDEYQIVVRPADRGAITLVLTIDKRSSLPYSLAITEAASHTTTCYFDYPIKGLADRSSLGIPVGVQARDVDESGELPDIAQTLQEGREGFDDYSALSVTARFDTPRPLSRCDPKRVLRRGNKWRIDDVKPADAQFVLPVDQNEALKAWHANKKQFRFSPVAICDGHTIGVFTWGEKVSSDGPLQIFPVKEDSQADFLGQTLNVPELCCRPTFPFRALDRHFEVNHQTVGNQELIKVDVSLDPTIRKPIALDATYWLNPSMGSVAVKIVYRDPSAGAEQIAAASKPPDVGFKDFDQSPRGFWYPTVILRDVSGNRAKTTRMYVDFNDTPSDDLFRISK